MAAISFLAEGPKSIASVFQVVWYISNLKSIGEMIKRSCSQVGRTEGQTDDRYFCPTQTSFVEDKKDSKKIFFKYFCSWIWHLLQECSYFIPSPEVGSSWAKIAYINLLFIIMWTYKSLYFSTKTSLYSLYLHKSGHGGLLLYFFTSKTDMIAMSHSQTLWTYAKWLFML